MKIAKEHPEEIFQNSYWIWPVNHSWDIHNSYAIFRKAVEITEAPENPKLYITADQSYQLYINGIYVNRGPARGYQETWPYDEISVGHLLRPGENLIAVRCHNPGSSNFQYLSCGFAGLLVAAHWGDSGFISDGTWLSRRQNGVRRDTSPLSMQLFCQEHIDLRVEDPNWILPDFDDSSWDPTSATLPWNAMPWYSLEERGIPLLDQQLIKPHRCVGQAVVKCSPQFQDARNVVDLRAGEGLSHVRCDTDAAVINVPGSPFDFSRSYLIDFGKTVVGSIRIELEGAVGGEVVDSFHAETVDLESMAPDFKPDAFCHMAFGNRLTCRPGSQSHDFYHALGFRYIVLTIRNSQSDLKIRLCLRQTLYPLIQNGSFCSSDKMLEKIWESCAWTQRVCSMDAYVDTPWREQAQWWGDARIQAKNTFFYSGDPGLFRRGLMQISKQTAPNGLTYGHAPTMAHTCILPDFSLIWLITLWDDYWQTGSLESIEKYRHTVNGILRYFSENTDEHTGLVLYDRRFWLFLDWVELPREGYSSVYNLWLLIALKKVAKLFRLLGDSAEADRLSEWASMVSKALQKLIRDDGLIGDGLNSARIPLMTASIHAQTLAIMACLDPKTDDNRVHESLLPAVRGNDKVPGLPSSYWINYVFQVLSDRGFGFDVVVFIRLWWEQMAEHGTTWEVFNPIRGDQSFSHAWSAHPLYHLMEIIGGIRQSGPGWKCIVFAPVFVEARGGAAVPTPLGIIQSKWNKTGSRIKVELNLPEGVSAQIVLPGISIKSLKNGGCWELTIPDADFIHPGREELK